MKFNFESIKESLTHKAKEAGVVAGIAATVAGPLEAQGADKPVQDKKVNPIVKQAETVKDAKIDSKTFVFGDKEGNETKEQMANNFEMAQEAVQNAGKGAYISKFMPGYVMVPMGVDYGPAGGSSYFTHGYKIAAYKVSDGIENGNFYFDVLTNALENASNEDVLKSLKESKDFKVRSRFNPTNGTDLTYLYERIREKISDPEEITMILQSINPSINKKKVIDSLAGTINDTKSFSNKKELSKDLDVLNKINTQTPPTNLASVME